MEQQGNSAERSANEWRWAVWLITASVTMFLLLNVISAIFQVNDEARCKKVPFSHELRIGVGDRMCVLLAPLPQAAAQPAADTVWKLQIDGTIVATSRAFRDGATNQTYLNFKLPKDDDAESETAIAQRRIWSGQAPDMITGLIDKQVTISGAGREIVLPNAQLRVFFPSMIVIGLLTLFLFVAGTVFACRSSGVIRDPANGTYSLARTQMMFWFVLVTVCFVLIYMSTGQMRGVLTPSTLALVGILFGHQHVCRLGCARGRSCCSSARLVLRPVAKQQREQ